MRPAILSTVALTVATHAAAQTTTPLTQAEALSRLLTADQPRAEWFTEDFLAQVPLATITAQLASIRQAFGAFLRMDTLQGRPLAVYERGTLIITVAPIDAQGRLESFGAVPGPVPSGAAPSTDEVTVLTQTLERIFTGQSAEADLFSADFLAAVPITAVNDQLTALKAQFGAVVRVETTGQVPQVIYERGAVNVTAFRVDAEGRVTALAIAPVTPTVAFTSLDEARQAFSALPGQVSVLVQEVGAAQPGLTLNASRLLAVGSAFKLAVLAELQSQISRGQRTWTDEVTLTAADKSLPSGTLQDAPVGSRYTLRDLATRMIRDSDNTATDLLMRVVGRPAIEARLGQAAIPSTREAFALKNPVNVDLLRAYRSAGLNTPARRDVLARATAVPLSGAALFMQGPVARDVEWFVSTSRLCSLMADVATLPEMSLNPGVASPQEFNRVSFKGGSEGGVLNLTTLVTTKAGRTYCVSATWNDSRLLDEQRFIAMYSSLLILLR